MCFGLKCMWTIRPLLPTLNAVCQLVPLRVRGVREEAARSWIESIVCPWIRTVSSAARLAV